MYFIKDYLMIPYRPMKSIFPRFGQLGMVSLVTLFFFGCASSPSNILKQEETMTHTSSIPSQEIRILTINV